MILELVEFNSPLGWTRQQVAEDARHVIPKWQANKELLRKHFLLELNGKTGAGVYIWPSVEAAKRAHDEDWRQSVDQAHRRRAHHPLFRPVPADRQRERQGQRIPASRRDQCSGRLRLVALHAGRPAHISLFIAGLACGVHVLVRKQTVDARHEAGHDVC